jgi:DNA-binding transcriptional regulator LsrR (DeoR family)
MPSYPVQWCGGTLPSHLTQAQVARLLGISQAAVADRCSDGRTMSLVPILGTKMIAVSDLWASGLLARPE